VLVQIVAQTMVIERCSTCRKNPHFALHKGIAIGSLKAIGFRNKPKRTIFDFWCGDPFKWLCWAEMLTKVAALHVAGLYCRGRQHSVAGSPSAGGSITLQQWQHSVATSTPQRPQKLRPIILHVEGTRNLRMAWQTKRQHLCRIAVPRFSMVDRNRSLSALERRAARHATTVVVPLHNLLTMASEIFFVLAL
jgi:hypothetical protein